MKNDQRTELIRSRFYTRITGPFLFAGGPARYARQEEQKPRGSLFTTHGLGELYGGRAPDPKKRIGREPRVKLGIPRVLRPSPITTIAPKLLVKPKRETAR